MKLKITPRRVVIVLTGLLFAAYSAYNIFRLFKDFSELTAQGILISAILALLFAVFTAYLFTAGIRAKDARRLFIRMLRRSLFIFAMLGMILLKLRMAGSVFDYLDLSFVDEIYTVYYLAEYCLTLAAMIILFIYYIIIRRNLPIITTEAIAFPVSAIILFVISFILDIILFFGYGVVLEASVIRTVVIRPLFYFGFIGLCVYFLFPPKLD